MDSGSGAGITGNVLGFPCEVTRHEGQARDQPLWAGRMKRGVGLGRCVGVGGLIFFFSPWIGALLLGGIP